MPVQFKASVTEPLPKNTEEVILAAHLSWSMEAEDAVNEAETGWKDFAEALKNHGLFVLDNEKNQVIFCTHQGGNREHETKQIRAMAQASAEGRLFVRAKDTGMLMQLRTKALSFENCELELSEQVREIPGVQNLIEAIQKPEKPSIWARIAAWFAPNSKYGQKVAAYDNYMAGLVKLPEQPVVAREPDLNEVARQRSVEEENNVVQQAQQSVIAQQKDNVLLNENEQQNENEQPKENEQQGQEYPKYGLKKYSKEGVEAGLARMNFGQAGVKEVHKLLPADSPFRFNGKELGLLVAMTMASPELSFSLRKSEKKDENKNENQNENQNEKKIVVKYENDPDVTYSDYVGEYLVKANPFNPMTKSYFSAAQRAVGAAFRQAATGDCDKLANIIAVGLTQNNKMLQNQQELSDLYTAYAEIGQMAIKLMNSNEQLKKAVMAKLGPDADQQIKIANTAKNISDFRVKAMESYQKIMKSIHLFNVENIKDVNGNVIGTKKTPIVTYKNEEIAQVALLCDIEMDMNFKKIDLKNSKFADPNEADTIVKDLTPSSVLNAVQWKPNRAAIFQNPKQMKDLLAVATQEMSGALEIKNVEREQGLDYGELYIDNAKIVEKKLENVGEFLYGEDFNRASNEPAQVPKMQ